MKRFYYLNTVLLLILTVFLSSTTFAQVAGDFRTQADGNWSAAGTWQKFNGTTWANAVNADMPIPATASVFIQKNHGVTLDVAQGQCKNVHINDAPNSKLNLGANVLLVSGKLRAYSGNVGTIPGTNSSPASSPITITAASAGKIKFVGQSRNITNTGEWDATNNGATTTFAVEIAMEPGETATMQTSIKASEWIFSNGNLNAGVNRIAVDNNSAGQGNITIKSGFTLISSASGAGVSSVFSRSSNNANGHGGTLTIEAGATLELKGTSPCIGMATIVNSGKVVFSGTAAQNLIGRGTYTTATLPTTYEELEINNGFSVAYPTGVTAVTINKSIALTSGNFNMAAAQTLTLNGNVTGNGTFKGNATAAMVIGGDGDLGKLSFTAGSELLGTLTYNRTHGAITLGSLLGVGILNLTEGKIVSKSPNLLTVANTINGGSSMAFVEGELARGTNNIATFEFPVAANGIFKPVALTTQDASTNVFSVKVSNATAGNVNTLAPGINHISELENWEITRLAGTTGVKIKMYWDNNAFSSFMSDATNISDLLLAHFTNGLWISEPVTITVTTSPAIAGFIETNNYISSFSPFTWGSSSPSLAFPVELLSFQGAEEGNENFLRWVTASENNNSFFTLEHSIDGIHFSQLTDVASAGNSTTTQVYDFEHKTPALGINYYRLSQTDIDGKTTVLGFLELANREMQAPTIYPNPVNKVLNINSIVPAKLGLKVEILSAQGQKVYENDFTQNEGENALEIDVQNLASGVYYVKMSYLKLVWTEKIVKM
jgi:hypothetical protein